MGRVMGGVIGLVFGIAWTGGAAAMGAPFVFPIFGAVFCLVAVSHIVIGLHNASARPEDRIGGTEIVDVDGSVFCKNCGQSIAEDSRFCKHCGSKQ